MTMADAWQEYFRNRSVDFSTNGLSESEWVGVCRKLEQNTGVRDLRVHLTNRDGDYISPLRKVLEKNNTVERFSLFGYGDQEFFWDEPIRGLSQNKSVKKLDILHWTLTSASAEIVLAVAKGLTDLTCKIDSDVIETFGRLLQQNSSITNLDLELWGVVTGREIADHLSSLFTHNSTIETVRLFDRPYQNRSQEIACVIRGLARNKSVTKLDITSIRSVVRFSLGDVLKSNVTLSDLSCCVDSIEDLTCLADGLKVNCGLKSLNLKFCGELDTSIMEVLAIIFSALSTNNRSSLKSLRVVDNAYWSIRASPVAIAVVQNLVQGCRFIKNLELYHDDESKDMLNAVLPGLRGGSSIQSLTLERHVWDTEIAQMAANLLRSESCSLKCLSLGSPNANSSNNNMLLEAACNSPILEKLDLHGCAISSATIEQLGKAHLTSISIEAPRLYNMNEAERKLLATTLPKNKSLECLKLETCGIGDEEVKELAEAIPQNTKLRTLSLCYNSIGDAGAKALGEALPKTETLKSLKLDGNDIGEDGSGHLFAGLEKNTSIEEFTGIPYDAEQTKAEYLVALNKAGYKAYKETEDMRDNDWVKALGRFESAGGLSARYTAVRAKPNFVFVRPDESKEPSAENNGLGKRKRDEDCA